MSDTTIEVAQSFTRYPGPRYKDDGEFSGETFREEVLAPALRDAISGGWRVIVKIDGVAGYGSSFLEESFGGLLRHGFSADDVRAHLKIVADTARFKHHLVRAVKYIDEEARRQHY